MENWQPVRYRDKYIILVAIPIISFINYHLTYSAIRWDAFFFLTYAIDTTQGYLAWWAARSVIVYLDKKLPWEKKFIKRIFVQIPLVGIVVVGLISLLTELVNFIARDKPLPRNFYTEDIIIFFIWTIFINFLYLSFYFLRRYQQASESEKVVHNDLLVKVGKQQKRVEVTSFTFFFVANEIVYGVTETGKIPMPGYTLDQLEKKLDPAIFFRANRQAIVTRKIIDQIQREENGKLSVLLKKESDLALPLMISRLRAPAFKLWMGN